jgi:hypothetical protein
VKRDGCKDKSPELNSINEMPITLLKKSSFSNGKDIRKPPVRILDAKSEQKKVIVPKFKEELSLWMSSYGRYFAITCLFWLCKLLWMSSYGQYFPTALSVKI